MASTSKSATPRAARTSRARSHPDHFEEEGRGQNLLPIQFLRQLIGFYGDRMQAFLPSFLELSLDSFIRQQERMHEQMTQVSREHGRIRRTDPSEHGPFRPRHEDVHALRFPARGNRPSPPPKPAAAAARDEDTLAELKKQMAAMQEQLAALSKSK